MEGVVRAGGLVFVRGELWRAESDGPLREGEQVQVEAPRRPIAAGAAHRSRLSRWTQP